MQPTRFRVAVLGRRGVDVAQYMRRKFAIYLAYLSSRLCHIDSHNSKVKYAINCSPDKKLDEELKGRFGDYAPNPEVPSAGSGACKHERLLQILACTMPSISLPRTEVIHFPDASANFSAMMGPFIEND